MKASFIPNNAISADCKKRRSFVAPLFAAGYGERIPQLDEQKGGHSGRNTHNEACLAVIGPTELKEAGGAALALLAALIYASYSLLARFIHSRVDPLAQASVITGVAALLFGAIVAQQGLTLPRIASGWFGVMALAMVSTVVAMTAFLAGVRRLGATGAATLSVAEPIVAAVAAAFCLEEPLGVGAAVGVALVAASTVLIVNGGARPTEKALAEQAG